MDTGYPSSREHQIDHRSDILFFRQIAHGCSQKGSKILSPGWRQEVHFLHSENPWVHGYQIEPQRTSRAMETYDEDWIVHIGPRVIGGTVTQAALATDFIYSIL
jgi:hypothetical protein